MQGNLLLERGQKSPLQNVSRRLVPRACCSRESRINADFLAFEEYTAVAFPSVLFLRFCCFFRTVFRRLWLLLWYVASWVRTTSSGITNEVSDCTVMSPRWLLCTLGASVFFCCCFFRTTLRRWFFCATSGIINEVSDRMSGVILLLLTPRAFKSETLRIFPPETSSLLCPVALYVEKSSYSSLRPHPLFLQYQCHPSVGLHFRQRRQMHLPHPVRWSLHCFFH